MKIIFPIIQILTFNFISMCNAADSAEDYMVYVKNGDDSFSGKIPVLLANDAMLKHLRRKIVDQTGVYPVFDLFYNGVKLENENAALSEALGGAECTVEYKLQSHSFSVSVVVVDGNGNNVTNYDWPWYSIYDVRIGHVAFFDEMEHQIRSSPPFNDPQFQNIPMKFRISPFYLNGNTTDKWKYNGYVTCVGQRFDKSVLFITEYKVTQLVSSEDIGDLHMSPILALYSQQIIASSLDHLSNANRTYNNLDPARTVSRIRFKTNLHELMRFKSCSLRHNLEFTQTVPKPNSSFIVVDIDWDTKVSLKFRPQ